MDFFLEIHNGECGSWADPGNFYGGGQGLAGASAATRALVAGWWVGCGRGYPPPAGGVWGASPRKFVKFTLQMVHSGAINLKMTVLPQTPSFCPKTGVFGPKMTGLFCPQAGALCLQWGRPWPSWPTPWIRVLARIQKVPAQNHVLNLAKR